ncbi:MAG: hypothetical protein ACRERX_23015 [Pseudomonas sp.]
MKKQQSWLKLIAGSVLIAALAACGGGGGGGTVADTSVTTPVVPAAPTTPTTSVATGIEGLAGSSCAFEYLPQVRLLDMDKAGYVVWYNGRVKCTLADGSTQALGGVPASAFHFTGNGVTSSTPEDMITGTSSIDLAPTYQLQTYRKFADATSVKADPENLVITGQDSLGRHFTATQTVNPSGNNAYALDDMTFGGMVAASRVIDADGMGYMATGYFVAYAAKSPSTSPACPSGIVKDYAAVTTNHLGQSVDRRYCMYTDLTSTAFFYSAGINFMAAATWQWFKRPDAGTLPSTLSVDLVQLSSPTQSGLRVPVYKVTSTVRFPKAPAPNFAGVETGPGGILYTVPGLVTEGMSSIFGETWNH